MIFNGPGKISIMVDGQVVGMTAKPIHIVTENYTKAEIERAKGAAEAIRIENGSITPAYIQYLWVRQQNAQTNNKIIYIPTEAGLPVLEAGRVAGKEK